MGSDLNLTIARAGPQPAEGWQLLFGAAAAAMKVKSCGKIIVVAHANADAECEPAA